MEQNQMSKKKKKSITKKRKDEIINIISSCLQQYGEIFAAYIFGSFISDKSFADIDLGILTQRKPDNLIEYEVGLEIKLDRLVKFETDVRVLNNAPLSFVQNVLRHGQLIIDINPNRRADFENNVLKKYFDFSRFRKRYLEDVIDAPV
jgi:predicted nucleotidyltransferase